jgi:DNA-binding transcriptional LysR family regulator
VRACALSAAAGEARVTGGRASTEPLLLAAPSFLLDLVMPSLVSSGCGSLRALSAAPRELAKLAATEDVDGIVTIGDPLELPSAWSRHVVGVVRFGLFGAPDTARSLGARPSPSDVARWPFVGCVLGSRRGDLAEGDDRCPLGRRDRTIAHDVQTASLACKVAAETDLLVYGPLPAAYADVARGALVEIEVPGWSVEAPVAFHGDARRIDVDRHDAIIRVLRAALRPVPTQSVVVPAAAQAPAASPGAAARATRG